MDRQNSPMNVNSTKSEPECSFQDYFATYLRIIHVTVTVFLFRHRWSLNRDLAAVEGGFCWLLNGGVPWLLNGVLMAAKRWTDFVAARWAAANQAVDCGSC